MFIVVTGIVIAVIALLGTVCIIVQVYNQMMQARVTVDHQFLNIDIILKQRADEIPELVKILKASSHYEIEKVTALLEAYANYQKSTEISDKLQSSQQIDGLMRGILMSSQQVDFHGLKLRLTEIETQLAHKREAFNDSVASFNALILRIPYILIAAMLKIEACQYLEVSASEKAYHGVDL
ncbi:MAG: LemA family protein [Wohlfahrtiimonas sp.]